jgi:hypothetical protein
MPRVDAPLNGLSHAQVRKYILPGSIGCHAAAKTIRGFEYLILAKINFKTLRLQINFGQAVHVSWV